MLPSKALLLSGLFCTVPPQIQHFFYKNSQLEPHIYGQLQTSFPENRAAQNLSAL